MNRYLDEVIAIGGCLAIVATFTLFGWLFLAEMARI